VHKIRFIALKEMYHILRDFRSLMIVLAMPIMMTFLYGFAINMDIENITISIVDLDKSAESRDLADRFYKSAYFSMSEKTPDFNDPEQLLRSGAATAILIIRPGFGEALNRQEKFQLGMTVDGTDASLATAVQSYSDAVLAQYLIHRLPEGFQPPGVTISRQVLYNPDLESAHFFVPGLVAIILMMISALLTSITIAREKETGTMEQLLTAPVKPYQIMLGKLLPYIFIAFIDGILVLAFAELVFDVPFHGSYLLLFLFGFIYVATALSIGILISSVVKTQQVAMMIALVSTLLPSVMLSGFIFAIKNMPFVLQMVSKLVAATWFIRIIRGVMLKATGFETLLAPGAALIGLMVILLTLATQRFKTRIG